MYGKNNIEKEFRKLIDRKRRGKPQAKKKKTR